ncbi:hypothetical protein OG616_24830 [Streptomyces antibioticus]|uniref:hypothetical protein n=1 Tax=Streptomyces antibioticus TaxID=1890 RepID=UPI0022559F80|nr:hypothetical protein [Streptomyces antibioticus]MCX5171227.1 hypothetical protein [Streptomyces antibioticus]
MAWEERERAKARVADQQSDRMAENREWIATKESAKGFFFCLAVLCLAGGAAWFGYVQIFTKGLERLPAKVCDGAVDRDVVIRALPKTRSAEEGATRQAAGEDLHFSCQVYTSGEPFLTGWVDVQRSSLQDWLRYYGADVGDDAVRVSVDGIEALAKLDAASGISSVYIPCAPKGVQADESSGAYAIIAEASVIATEEDAGAAVRQAVTDFAYQLAQHSYELAECQAPRDFPDALARYENG